MRTLTGIVLLAVGVCAALPVLAAGGVDGGGCATTPGVAPSSPYLSVGTPVPTTAAGGTRGRAPACRGCAAGTPPPRAAGCLTVTGVIARAASWLTGWHGGPVPYASSADPATWHHGYRRDCSGYVSMALGLPGPGHTTAQLAADAVPITREQLRAGDLLINPGAGPRGHVVIFDRWQPGTGGYLGYEQAGDGGTHHRLIPYPYHGGYPMTPYRWPGTAGQTPTATPPTPPEGSPSHPGHR